MDYCATYGESRLEQEGRRQWCEDIGYHGDNVSETLHHQVSKMREQCVLCQNFSQPLSGDLDLHCDALFDGIMCWPRTPAGQLVSLPCPLYIPEFYENGNGWIIK